MSLSRGSAKFRDALAKKLRVLRQRRGMTQERLAFLARLHPTYISILENGRKSPTVDVLYRIARTLGVRISRILASVEKLSDSSYPHG
jgi:transcriptional regulator with XRE-family HTH domain